MYIVLIIIFLLIILPLTIKWPYKLINNFEKYIDDKEFENIYLPSEGINLIIPKLVWWEENIRTIHNERKLRELIRIMWEKKLIDYGDWIDAGAWQGDNTIPWAKMISKTGNKVHAIDLSKDNIELINNIAYKNNINNFTTTIKGLSNIEEIRDIAEGSETHAILGNIVKKGGFSLTTIDNLVTKQKWDKIAFIHLDVEGFERKAIQGGLDTIKRYLPTIITESHTGDEMINDLLLLFGYSAYIIPEICGSDKSCRNTLWTTKKLPHDIIAFFHLPLESRFNLLS